MSASINQESFQSGGPSGSSRPIYWHDPLDRITAALCLLGALAFCRFLFPSHRDGAVLGALAAICLWRFGMHRAGILPWRSRISKRVSAFSWRQALIEGTSFFILMLAIFAFSGTGLRSSEIVLAAIGGVAFGVYGGWYSSGNPPRFLSPD
jgi:hypothetical protein